ncbi:MAG: PD-(D/E)XK nuclease family protein [Bacteroidales bacterium]|nr:PD-(D/E)XK nuclease family protein [Bacteroidales bacterium]
MKPFLAEVSEHIYKTHANILEDCLLVFPNRRAAIFLTQYLGKILEKPIWMPRMTTINEFITETGNMQVADDLLLNFDLHKIYNKVKKSNESFDEFYSWGEILLSDFDDIDKYLINPHDLFQNLASLKEIENKFDFLTEEQIKIITTFWKSFDPEKYSNQQKDFIEIWEVLEQIYIEFNILLNEKHLAYEGMVFRKVAEKIKSGNHLGIPYKKVFFVGFNALNKCEDIIFHYLKKEGLAEFYWDYDQYYLTNEYHEAGTFIRENIKKYPSPLSPDLFINLTGDKNIEVISCASHTGMVKSAGNILVEISQNNPKKDYISTAIVLADESMLIPALHAIPDAIDKVNITMGFPFAQSPVYGFLEMLFNLQKTMRIVRGEQCFYHQHVIEVIDHQLIHEKTTRSREIKNSIIQNNRIYIPAKEFQNDSILNKIFIPMDKTPEMGRYLLEITLLLLENTLEENTNNQLMHEFLYFLYTGINRLDEIIRDQNTELSKETYIRILRQIVKSIKIPFTGEPLAGLQIMGILETRALDFENLIMLSVNEGIIPKASQTPSFIPHNLRKAFGLTALDHQDSIYAFHFYRLLQRAKNVTLLYNSSAEGVKSGEMSRFIYQLKYEPAFKINESTITYNLVINPNPPIVIEKNKEIMEVLNQYTELSQGKKYLSPSAINTFLDCSLKFYFNYIAGLEEAETITEEVDAPVFGNIFHRLANLVYKSFNNKLIYKDDLISLGKDKEKINQLILQAYSDEYFKIPVTDEQELAGRNILIKEVLAKYIHQLLQIDTNYTPLEIVAMEDSYTMNLPVNVNNNTINIQLGGKIDRVDKVNGITRIIDYKTGNDKRSFKQLADLFHYGDKNRNKAAFQLGLYSLLYQAKTGDNSPLQPGLYLVKKFFEDNFDYRITQDKEPIEDFNNLKEEFIQHLTEILVHLFNPHTDFKQTEEVKFCEYCAYSGICGR